MSLTTRYRHIDSHIDSRIDSHIAPEDREDPSRMPAYRTAMEWSMDLFEVSRYFPAAEKYALTDPLRLASRKVCVHLAHAWRQQAHPEEFSLHVAEAGNAAAEAGIWLDFAARCQYLTEEGWRELHRDSRELSRVLQQLISG